MIVGTLRVRVKLQGALVFLLRTRPIPIHFLKISQDRVSVGECWIEISSLQCCPLAPLPCLLWDPIAPLAEKTVGDRQSNISHCVGRVLFFCLLEIQNAFLESFFCIRTLQAQTV